MSLIVETGAGLPDAESYISVADATLYFANRGNVAWPSSNVTQCEQALRAATDYMVGLYRTRWNGYRTLQTQALDWPRAYCPKLDIVGGYYNFPNYYANNVLPIEIANACAELAVRYVVNGDLAPDVERVETSIKVGPIAVEYQPGSSPLVTFTAVSRKLAPFFGVNGTKAVR